LNWLVLIMRGRRLAARLPNATRGASVALPEERPSSVGSDEAVSSLRQAGERAAVDRVATEPPQPPESFDAAAGVCTDPTLNPASNRIESGDYAVRDAG
jgi:hypothetical protein